MSIVQHRQASYYIHPVEISRICSDYEYALGVQVGIKSDLRWPAKCWQAIMTEFVGFRPLLVGDCDIDCFPMNLGASMYPQLACETKTTLGFRPTTSYWIEMSTMLQ